MNKKEKVLILVVAILISGMGIKSTVYDGMTPETEQEIRLYDQMQEVIREDNDNFLYSSGIMMTRIIAVKEEDGLLKGHYRKYVLGLFPMGDEYYTQGE